jgi:L-ornithine N5-oxygenase
MAAWANTPGRPLRVAVVGGGQSGAEAFIDLNDGYPGAKVDLILRAAVLKPADDSPFVNEIFSPEYTNLVFNQPERERERLIREYHNTNYSVVDLDVIERIYGILYRQKVSGDPRHRFLSRRVIVACQADQRGVELTLRDLATGEVERCCYDAVILATGYERTSHHRLLAPLAEYLGDFAVDRNYRVRAAAPLDASVFVQGFCQSTHGLSDTLLSVLPIRAAEVANALYDLASLPSVETLAFEPRRRALSERGV